MHRLTGEEDQSPKTAVTLSEQVFQELRADILCGRLLPGSKLRQTELCQTYKASGSAIREALSRLMSLGLVTAESQRGFRVAETSMHDLLDLTKTRVVVEVAAIRASIVNGTRDWEAQVVSAEYLLGGEKQKVVLRHLSTPAEEQRRARHMRFHDALVAACNLPTLMVFRAQLTALSDRYRFLSSITASGRDVAAEHRALAKAALSRNTAGAAVLIAAHFIGTAADVLKGFGNGEMDVDDAIQKSWKGVCSAASLDKITFEKARSLFKSDN